MISDHTTGPYLLPAYHLAPLIRLCGERLIDLPRLLTQEGIDPGVLQRQEQFIEYLAYVKVLNRAASLSRDPYFGHHVGKTFEVEDVGAMGALLRAQDCIANIYPLLAYLFDAQHRGTRHKLALEGDMAFHCVDYLVADQVSCDQLALVTLSGYHKVFKHLLGNHWQPSRLWLTQSKNPYHGELEGFFGCPIHFSATRNAFEFPRALLYKPIATARVNTPAIKRELAQVLDQSEYLGQLVAQYIEFQLRDGHCDKNSVAKALGVHPRVLHNCLQRRGLNYQTVLAQVRQRLASDLLANTDLAVSDIGQQLGFCDSRAFIRAFKGWFETTPMQWRKQNG